MGKPLVRSLFEQSSAAGKLRAAVALPQNNIQVSGLVGSAVPLVIAHVFNKTEIPFLVILNDKEEAAYHLNDLENILGHRNVLFYPSSYRRPYQIEETDNANVLLRSEVLNRISSRQGPALIVTYPE
ncbi:MAG: transcription-repair coupling factor, partial [Marinirhabdus sp.]